MDPIREILNELACGNVRQDEAESKLRALGVGYTDLGHTKLDTHRRFRRGVAEAVFCQNKTKEQVLEIASSLDASKQTVLCTRVCHETAAFVRASRPDFQYNEPARALYKDNEPDREKHGYILILSAGTSDIPVAEEAALSAELMGNRVERIYDVGVAGIHRLFGAASEQLLLARVVVVAAGMEGALPSVVAGLVSAPVIGLPTSVGYGASFNGLAALLGMLNSCSGGLAVVNIDNGFGAALMAHMINHVGATAK